MRRRAQEETEREAVVKVSYTRKRSAASVGRADRYLLTLLDPCAALTGIALWSVIGIAVLKSEVRYLTPREAPSLDGVASRPSR